MQDPAGKRFTAFMEFTLSVRIPKAYAIELARTRESSHTSWYLGVGCQSSPERAFWAGVD